MSNRLRIIPFRALFLSALLFSSGIVLLSCQSAALSSTTSSHPQVSWSGQAEGKCNFYYINRGKPPKSLSGKLDDDMALYEKWHSDLATRTVNALVRIGGAPGDGIRMINGMQTYAATSLEMANVYAQGGYQPRKMAEIESRRRPAQQMVQSMSARLRTPSCYSVVNPPE